MNKFDSSALQAIKHYDMLSQNDKVLIALSGGKDSVALLLFLTHYAKMLNITLYAAHVNHMIRSDEADNDERFCRELCEEKGVVFFSKRFNIPEIAREKSVSVEKAAREIRYGYFDELTKRYGIDKIATAHTASDNTETVLYNIMRGSGTQGICGIPPVRDNIIRPLIFCTKEQTEEYCNTKGVSFCIDRTNFDDVYDRNNIRLNIVPHMKKRNFSIDASVSHLSYIARCDRMLISSIADDFIKKHNGVLPLKETSEFFSDEKMLSCSHEILSRLCGHTLPFEIFMQCKNIICSKKTGKYVKISDGRFLTVKHDRVELCTDFINIPYYETLLPFNSTVKLNEKVTISVFTDEDSINYKNINNLTIKATLNFDTISGSIFARKKKDGDSYVTGGMTRSVKKYFSDSKIDRSEREYIPVICDSGGIIWVPGMKPCDRVKTNGTNKNITIVVEFSK